MATDKWVTSCNTNRPLTVIYSPHRSEALARFTTATEIHIRPNFAHAQQKAEPKDANNVIFEKGRPIYTEGGGCSRRIGAPPPQRPQLQERAKSHKRPTLGLGLHYTIDLYQPGKIACGRAVITLATGRYTLATGRYKPQLSKFGISICHASATDVSDWLLQLGHCDGDA